ncbi:MAG: hypothetical protein QXY70_03735, partial [Nanopusillaceae archaeon]
KIKFDLSEEKLKEFFLALKNGKIFKEAAYEILKEMFINKDENLDKIIEKLNLKPLSEEEIKKIVKEELSKIGDRKKAERIIISKLRGRADIKRVMEIMKEEG